MRPGTKHSMVVALSIVLSSLLVCSSVCLGQLYPLEDVNEELDGIELGSNQDGLVSMEQPLSRVRYSVADFVPERDARQVDMDLLQELVENLRQSDESFSAAPQQLNRHLPSAGLDVAQAELSTSGPINDPADFDVSLSQLTNSLNHWIPNTSNRSTLLDRLLSAYLEEQQQQLGNSLLVPREIPPHNDTSQVSAKQQTDREYIDQPLGLLGHHYMQGGAGEGHQLLGPDGTFENIQVIKTDLAVPSYCDPPNPCPIGYTAEDGCLEQFVNSASFSREYQVKQKCSCDNEHSLFNCREPPKSSIYNNDNSRTLPVGNPEQQEHSYSTDNYGKQLETLARAIQNRFGDLDSVRNVIGSYSG